MSILEVTEFAGKAQVLGAVRDVVVAGGKLEIRGIGIAEAQRILDHLSIGLVSVKLPEAPAASAPTAPEPVPEPALAAKPPVEDDLPGTLGQNGKGPRPGGNVVSFPPKPAEPAAAAPATPPPAGDETELVSKLATYRKLGDILAELHERGYTTFEQTLAICEKVQAQVPVLKTIPSLPDRIKRARDTMLGEAAN